MRARATETCVIVPISAFAAPLHHRRTSRPYAPDSSSGTGASATTGVSASLAMYSLGSL